MKYGMKVELFSKGEHWVLKEDAEARIKDLEAEVKRLRLREEYYLRQLTSRVAGPRAIDWRKRADADLLLKGVNPSGDTLGRKERDG